MFALVFSIVVTPLTLAFFALTDPAGLFDLEPTWQTALRALIFIGAMTAVVFPVTVFMFEYWWPRHSPDWMSGDEEESNMHLPDVRG